MLLMKRLYLTPIVFVVLASCAHKQTNPRTPASLEPPIPHAPGTGDVLNQSRPGNAEATVSCSIPLESVSIYGNINGAHVLDAIRTGRPVSVGKFQVSNLQSAEFVDRQILAPWYGGASGMPSNEVFEAARGTPLYHSALAYAFGSKNLSYYYQNPIDFFDSKKTAFLIPLMSAVSRDPECVRSIVGFAQGVLRQESYKAAFRELAALWISASESVRDNRVVEKFDEVARKKRELESDIEQHDKDIERAIKKDKREVIRLRAELRSPYQEIKLFLTEIPGCRTIVSRLESRSSRDAAVTELVDEKIEECQEQVEARIEKLDRNELRTKAQLEDAKEKREKKAEEVPSEQEDQLLAKLNKIQKDVERFQGYLKELLLSEEGNLYAHVNHLNQLVESGKKIQAGESYKDIVKSQEKARADLKAINPAYLSYGFFGGFDWFRAGAR